MIACQPLGTRGRNLPRRTSISSTSPGRRSSAENWPLASGNGSCRRCSKSPAWMHCSSWPRRGRGPRGPLRVVRGHAQRRTNVHGHPPGVRGPQRAGFRFIESVAAIGGDGGTRATGLGGAGRTGNAHRRQGRQPGLRVLSHSSVSARGKEDHQPRRDPRQPRPRHHRQASFAPLLAVIPFDTTDQSHRNAQRLPVGQAGRGRVYRRARCRVPRSRLGFGPGRSW